MHDHDPSRYGRSFADVYDDWYDDAPIGALVSFLAERLTPGARILELGVGTGRVALPLAAAGFDVVGLDSSPEMLERLAAKPGGSAITAVTGDAADAAAYPDGPFDAVVAVFNLLFNLTADRAQQACLTAAAGVLAPDGALVIEAFVPRPIEGRTRELATRTVADDRVVLIATDAEAASGIVRGNHVELSEGGVRLRPWAVRMASPAAIDEMATAAGLRLDERVEDAGGSPYVDGDSAHHLSLYRRSRSAVD